MKNRLIKLSAAALVAAMSTMPVMAEGNTYTPVTGTNTTFTKIIKLSATANVPNVTFKYTVVAGDAQAASDGNLAIFAGNDGVTSSGLPSIADILFTAGDGKDAGGTSIQKTGTVDFSKVTFNEPGVYRYVVTESGEAQGLTTTEDQTKAIDVYVVDSNGTLEVAGYVMHNKEDAKASQLD